MAVLRGYKSTASGWPHVYNMRSRHGRSRWYFWRGRRGDPQIRVAGDIIEGEAFLAAYARFKNGLEPYREGQISAAQTKSLVAATSNSFGVSTEKYPPGTLGWLLLEHEKTIYFQTLKNKKAIANQFRWIRAQPVTLDRSDDRILGMMPVKSLDVHAVQKIVNRKITIVEVEVEDKRNGGRKRIKRQKGVSQQTNLIKWLNAAMKTGIRLRVIDFNPIRDVERAAIAKGGYKMWTGEIWQKVLDRYPAGTKQHLVFHLAAYTSQRRGDVCTLGVREFIQPNESLPYGSFRIEQEKGSKDDGSPYEAHVPIFRELHDSMNEARRSGVLGDVFFITKDSTLR